MIKALNLSDLEQGLKTYLAQVFATAGVTTPRPDPENGGTESVVPTIIPGITMSATPATESVVAILAKDGEAAVPGWYEDLEVSLIAVSPAALQGITVESHRALFEAISAAFPNRPKPDAPAQDLADWAAVEAAISAAVEAATGGEYVVSGFVAASTGWAIGEDRYEQGIKLLPGVVHSSLLGV